MKNLLIRVLLNSLMDTKAKVRKLEEKIAYLEKLKSSDEELKKLDEKIHNLEEEYEILRSILLSMGKALQRLS